MFNRALYKREMKGSWKLLLIIAGILALYISVIIFLYDPERMSLLDEFGKSMPDLMNAFGMPPGATSLLGFMSSYLYGMLFLIVPMIFSIIRSNGLMAKYVDCGAMAALLAAPVRRPAVAFTQIKVIGTCQFALIAFITCFQILLSEIQFPKELDIGRLLLMNLGLLSLQLFIGGICFFSSCLFSDSKHSLALGAGLPSLMYLIQMMANIGGDLEKARYFTFFSLFNPGQLMLGDPAAVLGLVLLFIGAIILFASGITLFSKKDLHI